MLKIYLKIVDLRKSKCSIDSEIEMCVCALRQRWVCSVDIIDFFYRVRPFCEPNIWPKKRYWILDWNNKYFHMFEKRTHMQIVCILCFVSQLPIYCITILYWYYFKYGSQNCTINYQVTKKWLVVKKKMMAMKLIIPMLEKK